uniref:uncharacterized protein n=1 Tax=Myxine glutinosa TaxID=7769 RepID=UPI00358F49B5
MFAAYQRFCRTTSMRAQYFQNMLEMCNLINDPDWPKGRRLRELEVAEITKGEAAVQHVITSIHSFSNPFTIPNKDKLYSLAYGTAASPEVEFDVLRAETAGQAAKQEFIEKRFKNQASDMGFFDPVKKLKLLTMEAGNKVAKLTSSEGKNDINKEQLCQLLLRVWSSKAAVSRREGCTAAVLVMEGMAHRLTVTDGEVSSSEIHCLRSKQEETHTRVVLYLQYALSSRFKDAVVCTPDTDIFVILLHYASSLNINIHLDTGTRKQRQLIDITALAKSLGSDHATALMGLYTFTGDDCNSAFRGKGKVGPLKKHQKYPRFQKAFIDLGSDWKVKDEDYDALEEFTCLMYGTTCIKSINEVRALMLRKMVGDEDKLTSKSKVDFSQLPPCKDSPIRILTESTTVSVNEKRSHVAIYDCPLPQDGHSWIKDDGPLEPLWSRGPVLPPSMVDILEKGDTVDEKDDEEDEVDDYDELLAFLAEDDE